MGGRYEQKLNHSMRNIIYINHNIVFGGNTTCMHLADAFIQSDLQCIQAIHLYCQYVCFLGVEPTTFALLTQCSTTEPQEHTTTNGLCIK